MADSASTTSKCCILSPGGPATVRSSKDGIMWSRHNGLHRALTRRHALAMLTAVVLARCGSNPDIDFATVRQLVMPRDRPRDVSREQAAQVPFATIGIRVDGGAQTMLVLATDTGGDLLWTSAARAALLTRGGRILQSAGFRENLAATRFQDGDALMKAPQASAAP